VSEGIDKFASHLIKRETGNKWDDIFEKGLGQKFRINEWLIRKAVNLYEE